MTRSKQRFMENNGFQEQYVKVVCQKNYDESVMNMFTTNPTKICKRRRTIHAIMHEIDADTDPEPVSNPMIPETTNSAKIVRRRNTDMSMFMPIRQVPFNISLPKFSRIKQNNVL